MPLAAGSTIDPKNHVAAVAKAITLLELFGEGSGELTLTELVDRGGYTRTTTHRLLSTLELMGWLERSGERYRLSLAVFRLGSSVVNGLQLRNEASHVLSELAAHYGDDVYLVVPDGPRAVCLERIEGKTPIHIMVLDIGRSLPLYVGGGPVALLAHREQDLLPRVLEDGPGVTPTGQPMDEAAMRRMLEETRTRGYSRSLEDVTHGVGAFGAPIFNARGVAVGAISIGGMVDNIVPREKDLSSGLLKAAGDISRRMGYSA